MLFLVSFGAIRLNQENLSAVTVPRLDKPSMIQVCGATRQADTIATCTAANRG